MQSSVSQVTATVAGVFQHHFESLYGSSPAKTSASPSSGSSDHMPQTEQYIIQNPHPAIAGADSASHPWHGKTGWVYKLSSYLRVWRRRYAYIKYDYELHFTSSDQEDSSDSNVIIDLRKCKTIRKVQYDGMWKKIDNVIEIPSEMETLYMYPEVSEETEEWIVSLKNRILNANIGFSLWQAAEDGSIPAVNSILSIPGVDVNYSNQSGATVLYAAAAAGHCDVVKLLISEAGADANKANREGVSPLHIAVHRGYTEVVHSLIDSAAAEINQCTYEKRLTALHIAADTQRAEIAKALIHAGADVNLCAENNWTALSYAVANQDVEMALILLEANPNIEIGIQPGNITPMRTAVETGNKDIVYLLLEANANVNAVNTLDETTPLLQAVRDRFLDISRALIAAGAEVEPHLSNPHHSSSSSPLFIAVRNNDLEMVRLLLSAGAKVNRVDPESQMTALDTANVHGYHRVADALIDAGASHRQTSKGSSDEESYGSFG